MTTPRPGVGVADPLPDPERRGLRHPVVDVAPRAPVHRLNGPFQVVLRLVVGGDGGVPAGRDEPAGGAPQPGADTASCAAEQEQRPPGGDQRDAARQGDTAQWFAVAAVGVEASREQQPQPGDQQHRRHAAPNGRGNRQGSGRHIGHVCGEPGRTHSGHDADDRRRPLGRQRLRRGDWRSVAGPRLRRGGRRGLGRTTGSTPTRHGPGNVPVSPAATFRRGRRSWVASLPLAHVDEQACTLKVTLPIQRGARTVRVRRRCRCRSRLPTSRSVASRSPRSCRRLFSARRAVEPIRTAPYQSAWTAVPLCSVATVPLALHAIAADISGQLSIPSCQCLAMPAGDS